MFKTRKNKRVFIFFISVLAFFGTYFTYQIKDYFNGPKISMDGLLNWSETNDSYFEIKGRAKNISEIDFNGRKVYTDENGFFNENLILARGINFLRLKARDKFGREIVKSYFVVLKDEN